MNEYLYLPLCDQEAGFSKKLKLSPSCSIIIPPTLLRYVLTLRYAQINTNKLLRRPFADDKSKSRFFPEEGKSIPKTAAQRRNNHTENAYLRSSELPILILVKCGISACVVIIPTKTFVLCRLARHDSAKSSPTNNIICEYYLIILHSRSILWQFKCNQQPVTVFG